ncbi:homeobox protein Hox-A6 isoform X2 [Oxyura jamaicensis]|uniref:homeobox protein Hox-A6 isoform X2 n=1 Tax=Oxyura jamaicensis TaxID=8884 RepID=UPI0015A5B28D|nr:homeobox protein Hox-A6 isoform X2 [Oxyura jamaicensis]
MSSYFVNPTFPGSLPSGQDSFLGQIPLYPAGYDALRHFPASYGASSLQDKTYTSPCFYQQSNTVLACNRASYEYGASCFYSDKEIGSASPSGSGKQRGHGDYPHFSPEQQYKSSGVQAKIVNDEGTDRKYTSPVYPWMQRMNSCAGYVCLLAIQIVSFRYRSIQTTSSQYCMKNGSLQVKRARAPRKAGPGGRRQPGEPQPQSSSWDEVCPERPLEEECHVTEGCQCYSPRVSRPCQFAK